MSEKSGKSATFEALPLSPELMKKPPVVIKSIYAVKDARTGQFTMPWACASDAEADRAFGGLIGNPDHAYAKWPSDFSLYRIGSYNFNTATLDESELTFISDGSSWRDYWLRRNREEQLVFDGDDLDPKRVKKSPSVSDLHAVRDAGHSSE